MSGVLLHIGYPKAGSTYLQNWFSDNPSMYYDRHAIAGFKHAHDMARYAQHTEKLPEYFVLSSENLSVWKGEADIALLKSKPYDFGAYHRNLSKILYGLFPTAKILIVTRGYLSLFLSLYSEYIRGGGIATFAQFQKEYAQQFGDWFDYNWLIDLYTEIYGAGNVILLPYELLRDSPSNFMARLEQQLDMNEHFEFTAQKINASLPANMLTAQRKLSKFLFNSIRWFPANARKRILIFYMGLLRDKKIEPLIRFFAGRIKNPETLEVANELLLSMQGKADILKTNELYKPYLHEYLLAP